MPRCPGRGPRPSPLPRWRGHPGPGCTSCCAAPGCRRPPSFPRHAVAIGAPNRAGAHLTATGPRCAGQATAAASGDRRHLHRSSPRGRGRSSRGPASDSKSAKPRSRRRPHNPAGRTCQRTPSATPPASPAPTSILSPPRLLAALQSVPFRSPLPPHLSVQRVGTWVTPSGRSTRQEYVMDVVPTMSASSSTVYSSRRRADARTPPRWRDAGTGRCRCWGQPAGRARARRSPPTGGPP